MADFTLHSANFAALDTEIIALSADNADDTRAFVQTLGVEFDVLHGLDPTAIATTVGTYTGQREGRPHLQPAAFVVDKSGKVLHAVYSSGKVGRLTSHDVLSLLMPAKPLAMASKP